MAKMCKYGFLLLALSLSSGFAYASERAGDFALLDQNGYFHKMSWYNNNRAVVLLVQGNGSVDTERELAGFKALQEQHDEGVVFFMINPRGETRADVRSQLQAWNIDVPVLIDDVSAISESLEISHFGQAVIFDPTSFRVEYSGPAGAQLESALNEVVAGKAVSNPVVAVQGEAVTYPERDITQVSYSKDVAPIIAQNCASCHREGGIAPFALNSHAMLQGWSPMIREVLRTRRMPPGQVDPHVGEYSNGMTLAFEDERKILDWIAAGSPRDAGTADPLAQLTWSDSVWMFDTEPDLIIEVPEQTIAATGVIDYINVVVPIQIDRDRWVRASQYVAGDPRVLHHTLNFLIPPGADPRGGFTATPDPDAAYIQAYVPGATPHIEPENTGGLLRKDSMLALQLHYTTFGQEARDNSRIGLWFYDDDEIPTERMTGECACIFTPTWTNIPPNDPEFIQTASIMIDADAHLHGFISHMHFRGKYMRFEAHLPDGSVQDLLNVADYNYNWQITYNPVEPIFVPGGTKIHVVGAFDNSAQNPANPDPSRSVPWGQQSWDEMFFGQVYYKYVDQSRYHQEPALVSSAN